MRRSMISDTKIFLPTVPILPIPTILTSVGVYIDSGYALHAIPLYDKCKYRIIAPSCLTAQEPRRQKKMSNNDDTRPGYFLILNSRALNMS